ncbi:sarcosine oxidase subunit gamma family protein [Rhodococcus sp. G-MC3]|uniref:sarcosine oxidase subunit gamma n=1 Tax=Rhodococcus sp. G-MC3 TaxID=3046209 RepID=UPI0024BB4EC6|nr:sarcosine oxidase subunit gamma family protein [Rhodococcus sp. G-MC3]MDJ0392900.1 sarcosine oxidase subunit gamma family protein [Rhodococcus sp. G-MC3]
MADLSVPISPLHGLAERCAAQPESVSVWEEPFTAMTDLWVDPTGEGGRAAAVVLGAALPASPGRSIETTVATAIWFGPEEWLVTSRATSAADLESSLQQAVRPHGGSATDVSAQRTSIRLSGEHARFVLSKGCSLDLHPSVYSPGTAQQTMLGQAAVVIIALDDGGADYRLLVRSSFARYLLEWLFDASAEF